MLPQPPTKASSTSIARLRRHCVYSRSSSGKPNRPAKPKATNANSGPDKPYAANAFSGSELKPHIEAMRSAIAARLGVDPDQVGVKATTNEKLGPCGREEGIACHAVALLTRP